MATALLLAPTLVTTQILVSEDEETPPAYVLRGDHVEATYEAFVKRLERYQTRLRSQRHDRTLTSTVSTDTMWTTTVVP